VLPLAIRVYPVPTAGNVFIQSEEEGSLAIQVVDLQGRIVYETTETSATIEIPSTEWQSGWYQIRAISANGKQTSVPFVKQ
jgi:hypothetical protein